MAKAGFGDHLKREREMRAVSLNEVCAATRISVRFLEALEGEEWDKLPGGIFNRGFVRAVARFLGLDEEDFVAEYELATQQQSAPQGSLQPPVQARPRPRWIAWLGVAAVLVLAAMGWLGWHWYSLRRAQRSSSSGAAQGVDFSSPPAGARSSTSAAAVPGSTTAENTVLSPSGEALQLKIEAGKATTLTIAADGQPAFSGRIIAGQTRTFTAQDSFEVSAQDAGALLLQLNGRTLAPIGPPGQPGTVTLTHRDASVSGGAN